MSNQISKARLGNQNARKPEEEKRVPFAARLPGDVVAAIHAEQIRGAHRSQADALSALVRKATP